MLYLLCLITKTWFPISKQRKEGNKIDKLWEKITKVVYINRLYILKPNKLSNTKNDNVKF